MTSSRFGVSAIIAGLVLVAGVQPARGTFVTFAFEGVVFDVIDRRFLVYPELVWRDAVLSGTYTLDLDTPDSLPDDPTYGVYDNAAVAFSGQVGLLAFEYTPGDWSQIQVADNITSTLIDVYEFDAGSSWPTLTSSSGCGRLTEPVRSSTQTVFRWQYLLFLRLRATDFCF